MPKTVGAIDAGGTTFKCGVFTTEGTPLVEKRVATTTPDRTISACAEFFREAARVHGALTACGIASFGPIDIDPRSEHFGRIGKTPKKGWSGIELRKLFASELQVPVSIETDVNAALLSEMHDGAACGLDTAAYVTIGTGIGVAASVRGHMLAWPDHPEFGHKPVRLHQHDADFQGTCSIHGNCLEGLASGPAVAERFGDPAGLPRNHQAWEIVAHYLGQLCLSLQLLCRFDRIIVGGGLMQAPGLLSRIRSSFSSFDRNYSRLSNDDLARLIVSPLHGSRAGLRGAFHIVHLQERPHP